MLLLQGAEESLAECVEGIRYKMKRYCPSCNRLDDGPPSPVCGRCRGPLTLIDEKGNRGEIGLGKKSFPTAVRKSGSMENGTISRWWHWWPLAPGILSLLALVIYWIGIWDFRNGFSLPDVLSNFFGVAAGLSMLALFFVFPVIGLIQAIFVLVFSWKRLYVLHLCSFFLTLFSTGFLLLLMRMGYMFTV